MISLNPGQLPKAALRTATVGAVLGASMLAASPAFAALHRDDGDDPGPGISKIKMLGVFVGIPVGLFLLIALLASIPSMIKGPKYRPGKEWQATPEWYGAPGDGDAELGAGDAHAELTGGGGVVGGELTGTVVEPAEGDGGTSARW